MGEIATALDRLAHWLVQPKRVWVAIARIVRAAEHKVGDRLERVQGERGGKEESTGPTDQEDWMIHFPNRSQDVDVVLHLNVSADAIHAQLRKQLWTEEKREKEWV